jgi:hypothetical protein
VEVNLTNTKAQRNFHQAEMANKISRYYNNALMLEMCLWFHHAEEMALLSPEAHEEIMRVH